MLHPNSRTPLRDTPLRRNLGPRHLTARTRLVTATNAEKCESRVSKESLNLELDFRSHAAA
ncbi:hypothetical protein NSERKGN1266_50180 [Nocardia seriolae]|nr:hypothetical protein NSERKGN1266_50180 [Nocardia seriolae]